MRVCLYACNLARHIYTAVHVSPVDTWLDDIGLDLTQLAHPTHMAKIQGQGQGPGWQPH